MLAAGLTTLALGAGAWTYRHHSRQAQAVAIEPGTTKGEVIRRLGKPDKWLINPDPQAGQNAGFFPDPSKLADRHYSRPQAFDEEWLWKYGSVDISIRADAVASVQDRRAGNRN